MQYWKVGVLAVQPAETLSRALRVYVPEAPMDENCLLHARERDIGSARDALVVHAEVNAHLDERGG